MLLPHLALRLMRAHHAEHITTHHDSLRGLDRIASYAHTHGLPRRRPSETTTSASPQKAAKPDTNTKTHFPRCPFSPVPCMQVQTDGFQVPRIILPRKSVRLILQISRLLCPPRYCSIPSRRATTSLLRQSSEPPRDLQESYSPRTLALGCPQ